MVAVMKDLILYYSPAKNKYLKCISIKRHVSQKLFVFCVYYGTLKLCSQKAQNKDNLICNRENVH